MLWLLLVVGFGGDPIAKISLTTEDFALQPWHPTLRVDAKGNIYVADPGSHTIRVFAENGTYLRDIGRQGQGPGEIKRWFGTFEITGDQLYQVDYFEGNRFINVFGLDGTLLKIVNLRGIAPTAGPSLAVPLDDKRILFAFDHDYSHVKKGPLFLLGPMQTFSEIDHQGHILKKHFEQRAIYEVSEYPDREGRSLPGSDGLLAAFFAPTGSLILQKEHAMSGQVLDLATGTIRSFSNGFKRVPVDREAVENHLKKRLEWVRPPWREYETKLYRTLAGYIEKMDLFDAVVKNVYFSTKGEIVLVGKRGSQGTFPIHIVDGKSLAVTLKTTSPTAPFHMTHNRVYALEGDEDTDDFHVIITSR